MKQLNQIEIDHKNKIKKLREEHSSYSVRAGLALLKLDPHDSINSPQSHILFERFARTDLLFIDSDGLSCEAVKIHEERKKDPKYGFYGTLDPLPFYLDELHKRGILSIEINGEVVYTKEGGFKS